MSCASSCLALETAWFEKAWREDRFETWFHPIVDTGGESRGSAPRRVLAHKCSIRLFDGRLYGEPEILEAAKSYDEAGFAAYARRLTIRSAASQRAATQDRNAVYFIRVTPASLRNWDPGMEITLGVLEK